MTSGKISDIEGEEDGEGIMTSREISDISPFHSEKLVRVISS